MNLDDFLEDLQEDIQKAEKEEVILPQVISRNTPIEDSVSNKRLKQIKPTQLIRPPQVIRQEPKKVVIVVEAVKSAPPSLNPDFLQELRGSTSTDVKKPVTTVAPPQKVVAKSNNNVQYVFPPPSSSSASQTSSSSTTSAGTKPSTSNEFKLFIGNLSIEARDDHLAKVFKDYSSITNIQCVLDAEKEKCKGFAFITFRDPMEMLKAMREKQGKLCGNRPMLIHKAKTESKEEQTTHDHKNIRKRKL